MPIISFVSSKGGVGKTTASLLATLGLAEGGRRVTVIDADPNLPIVRWGTLPGRPENVTVLPAPSEAELTNAMRRARFGTNAGRPAEPGWSAPEWIVIDTEGGARAAMHTAIRLADLVVTPSGPSQLEAVEALKVVGYVREASKTFKRPIPYACALTRIPAAVRPRSLKLVVDQLREAGVPIVPTPLIEKEAFRALFSQGGTLETLDAKLMSGLASAKANHRLFAEDLERLAREARASVTAVEI